MAQKHNGPGDVGASRGAHVTAFHKATPYTSRSHAREALTVRILPGGDPITVVGRLAQTLQLLIDTRERGFTSGEASPLGWARRTSAYVQKLRELGFPIATVRERAGDATVGRYILMAPVAAEVAP